MTKQKYLSTHFGKFLAEIQRRVYIDGRRLSNADICRLAHISTRTYGLIKKG